MRSMLIAAALLGLAGCATTAAPGSSSVAVSAPVQQALTTPGEPEAWCSTAAADDDFCRRTSATDHEVCRRHKGDAYDRCRRAVEHLRLMVERQRRQSVVQIDI